MHLINLIVHDKQLDPAYVTSRIRSLTTEAADCASVLRSTEGKARDANFFEKHGDAFTLAIKEHEKWRVDHLAQEDGEEGQSENQTSESSVQSPPRSPTSPTPQSPTSTTDPVTTPTPTPAPLPPASPPKTPSDPPLTPKNIGQALLNEAVGICEELESALDDAYDDPNASSLVHAEFDPCTPLLLVLAGVLGLRGLAMARRYSFNDVLVMASRYAKLTQKKRDIGKIAKKIAKLDAETKASNDYSDIDLTQPVCAVLNQAEEDETVIANVQAERVRLTSDPLAVAAQIVTGGGEYWMQESKTSSACGTQSTIVQFIVVFIKVLMQIPFDEWEKMFKGAREQYANEFQEIRLFGEKIYGGPIGQLSLADIFSKVLVEASYQDLSEEEKKTEAAMRARLQKDMVSRKMLPFFEIAESESLVMASEEVVWTPSQNGTLNLSNPHFSRKDNSGDKRRRSGAKYLLHAFMSRRVVEAMVPLGFSASQTFEFGLSILCVSPTAIDRDIYNFLGSDDVSTLAPTLLAKNGTVPMMLAMFTKKKKSFGKNYEFLDIADDRRDGTRSMRELVTAYIDMMIGNESGKGANTAAPSETGGEENAEEEADVDSS